MNASWLHGHEDVVELALFDVDGPITHPQSRKIEQPEILDLTLDFIARNGYVAYNTGRARSIVHERVISPLLARALTLGVDPAVTSRHISIFAEKGAVAAFWDNKLGQWKQHVDPATEVPAELRSEVANLLRSDHEFQTHIFYDSDKETMVSVEMRHETSEPMPVPVTVDAFKPIAERFASEARQLAVDLGYDDLEVDCTTIAVDVQRRGVGKDLGARLAFGWLDDLGKQITKVHCFGDSRSDVAMAAEAFSAMSRRYADPGERVVYIEVGGNLAGNEGFEVRSFPNMYGLGTVAYLKALS
jgi:hypothetical protein